jgi:hypothetical protein
MCLFKRARASHALSLVLCAVLLGAMAVPAFAAKGDDRSDRAAAAGENGKAKGNDKNKDEHKATARSQGRSQAAKSSNASSKGQSSSAAKSSNASTRRQSAKSDKPSNGSSGESAAAAENQDRASGENSPAGNKGSMKVRPVGTPAHPPRNYAHLPCIVQVDFYGSPHSGATLTAVSHAPTAPAGQTLLTTTMTFDQSSPNPRGNELVGTTTLDFTSVVDGLSYHEQQGYHVKLTAVQDGPQGGDVKHKVFWIDCGAPAADESGEASAESGADAAEDIDTADAAVLGSEVKVDGAAADGEVMGLAGSAEDTEVAGVMVVRDEAVAGVDGQVLAQSGEDGVRGARVLAATGIGVLALALLGLVGLGGGAGMLRRFRTRP